MAAVHMRGESMGDLTKAAYSQMRTSVGQYLQNDSPFSQRSIDVSTVAGGWGGARHNALPHFNTSRARVNARGRAACAVTGRPPTRGREPGVRCSLLRVGGGGATDDADADNAIVDMSSFGSSRAISRPMRARSMVIGSFMAMILIDLFGF